MIKIKYNCVIFDLDGVICKTDEYHYRAWKIVAERMKLFFDENINNKLRGVSRMECVDIILWENNLTYQTEEKVLLASNKNDVYVQLLKQLNPSDLEKDVIYTLQSLKENHYKIAVASGSKNAKQVLKQLEIIDLFDVIVDGNDIINTKPDPEIFLTVIDRLKVPSHKVLVVEDATVGLQASNCAQIDVVAFGSNCDASLAKYKVLKISDILKILKI